MIVTVFKLYNPQYEIQPYALFMVVFAISIDEVVKKYELEKKIEDLNDSIAKKRSYYNQKTNELSRLAIKKRNGGCDGIGNQRRNITAGDRQCRKQHQGDQCEGEKLSHNHTSVNQL